MEINSLRETHVPKSPGEMIAAVACLLEAYDDPEALVEAMCAGPKASLRSIHDQIVKLARKLGKDVVVMPCKTYVSLWRKQQFAIVKPTTRTRVDLGFTLLDVKLRGRLEAVRKAAGDRISHVIKLESPKEIDEEVKCWLSEAYKQNA
jgi:Domain of unknown function (DUF5655)